MGVLLCLALGATVFCAVQTVKAIQRFQQEQTLVVAGDVRTIQPWMTIRYISRVYHVPENYLYEWLHITNPQSVRHTSLRSLAKRNNQSLDGLIGEIQTAIETYRKQHPYHPFASSPLQELFAPGREREKT